MVGCFFLSISAVDLLFLYSVCCLLSFSVSSAAKHRAETNGQNLTDEWLRNAEIKRKKKLEDEERNSRVRLTRPLLSLSLFFSFAFFLLVSLIDTSNNAENVKRSRVRRSTKSWKTKSCSKALSRRT
jgi:hypothetical protein